MSKLRCGSALLVRWICRKASATSAKRVIGRWLRACPSQKVTSRYVFVQPFARVVGHYGQTDGGRRLGLDRARVDEQASFHGTHPVGCPAEQVLQRHLLLFPFLQHHLDDLFLVTSDLAGLRVELAT